MTTAAHPTILVADDDADIREVLSIVFDLHGFGTAEAADGVEALARLRDTAGIVLVVLDLMMPKKNGIEVLAEMKADSVLRAIPVIVLSGDRRAREEARELRAEGCLVKPVEHADLMREVTRFVAPPHPAPGIDPGP